MIWFRAKFPKTSLVLLQSARLGPVQLGVYAKPIFVSESAIGWTKGK